MIEWAFESVPRANQLPQDLLNEFMSLQASLVPTTPTQPDLLDHALCFPEALGTRHMIN